MQTVVTIRYYCHILPKFLNQYFFSLDFECIFLFLKNSSMWLNIVTVGHSPQCVPHLVL